VGAVIFGGFGEAVGGQPDFGWRAGGPVGAGHALHDGYRSTRLLYNACAMAEAGPRPARGTKVVLLTPERMLARASRRFLELDLTGDVLPDADVLLCRDGLVHLSYANIQAVLANVAHSNIRFMLMTSFPGRRNNYDIADGDWRPLDFQAPPFSFPEPRLTIVEKCEEEGGSYADKSLLAWRVDDLPPLGKIL